jgi:hypothetical protein
MTECEICGPLPEGLAHSTAEHETPAEKSRAEVFFRLDGFITATVGSTRGYALRDIVESLEAQAAKWRRRLEAEA